MDDNIKMYLKEIEWEWFAGWIHVALDRDEYQNIRVL
jgi:hypothetical protein